MRFRMRFVLQAVVMVLFSLACGPIDLAREILGNLPTPTVTPGTFEIHTSDVWYVELDGDDSNPCDATLPCRTINHVMSMATDNDQIYIGAGIFDETPPPGSSGVMIRFTQTSLRIQGEGPEATIIDAGGTLTGIYVSGDASGSIRNLTVRNAGGVAPGNCISHRSTGDLVIQNVVVEHCYKSGIQHSGDALLRLVDVIARDAYTDEDGFGGIGVNSLGPLEIDGGEFVDNELQGILSGRGLQMTGGLVEGNGTGGMVVSEGMISGVTVRQNNEHPRLAAFHPGIRTGGPSRLEIAGSTITENEVCVQALESAMLVVRDSTLSSCPVGGLDVWDTSTVAIENVVIEDNGIRYADTSIPGGVINNGDLRVVASTIRANHNGGIGNYNNLTLVDSLLIDNRGGLASLYNFGDATVSGTLLTGDLSDYAALDNRAAMTMTNSTVSGNLGGGITSAAGALTLEYVTISNNAGIGLNSHVAPAGIASVSNTLVANNAGDDCRFGDFAGPPPRAGTNIDSDGTCDFSETVTLSDLMLDELADNGGPTLTHALLPDSPAIDAASGDCPGGDQRGAMRPSGDGCDVGAYELDPFFIRVPTSLEGTPPPPASGPMTNSDTLCWKGPGPGYEVVQSIVAEIDLNLLGTGAEGLWFIVDSPRFPGQPCWLPQESVDVDPGLDVSGLQVFPIPPLPTATPPQEPPATPGQLGIGNVVCSGQDYIVSLSWMDAATTEDGYRVYRNGSLIATLGANATQYTDNDAPATGSPVTYGVEAFNVAGASGRPEVVEPGCLF